MDVKKILLLFITVLSLWILSSCVNEDSVPEVFEINVSSNIDEVIPQYFESSVVNGVQSYVFSTYEIEGYSFLHWRHDGFEEILSTELSFVYSPTSYVFIKAIYEPDDIVEIPNPDPSTNLLSMDLDSYYDEAEGLYGVDLITALNTILNDDFKGVTYGEARYILDESDMDPSDPDNIILVYLRTSVSGIWDSGVTWNREHVWPQSLLGASSDNRTVNIASDLFNLMPSNTQENSNRGNKPYSEVLYGYEPHDEVKGDVARALFYMMIMYEELNLVNSAPSIYEMGYLDELLLWHNEDPVSEFEQNRLEVIYSYQNNRNPFVDYPHLVELIWGDIEE